MKAIIQVNRKKNWLSESQMLTIACLRKKTLHILTSFNENIPHSISENMFGNKSAFNKYIIRTISKANLNRKGTSVQHQSSNTT